MQYCKVLHNNIVLHRIVQHGVVEQSFIKRSALKSINWVNAYISLVWLLRLNVQCSDFMEIHGTYLCYKCIRYSVVICIYCTLKCSRISYNTELYSTVMYYSIQKFTIQYNTGLNITAPYINNMYQSTVLNYMILYFIFQGSTYIHIQQVTAHFSTVLYHKVYYCTKKYTTVPCSRVLYSVIHYWVIQNSSVSNSTTALFLTIEYFFRQYSIIANHTVV